MSGCIPDCFFVSVSYCHSVVIFQQLNDYRLTFMTKGNITDILFKLRPAKIKPTQYQVGLKKCTFAVLNTGADWF